MALSKIKQRAQELAQRLQQEYPDAHCALVHQNAVELLVATILSAQCTDARVNIVTPNLFKRYPDAEAFAMAEPDALREAIRSCGYFNQKANSIQGACDLIFRDHGGSVPSTMEELIKLPGVGRKTANCVLGTVYGKPAMVIDTHMVRIMNLLGLTRSKDPKVIEQDLMKLLPPEEWVRFVHGIIDHGRAVCIARRPQCAICCLADFCPKAHTPALPAKSKAKKVTVKKGADH